MNDFEKSTHRLQQHIFGLKSLVSNPDLGSLARETGIMGQGLIEMHNVEGRYLGGEYATKGYSTTNLPLFFFGDITYIQRTKNIRLNAPQLNIGNLLIKSTDIFWTTQKGGKKTAWLKGGYATFLKYARPGKDLNKVDHTFTGAMLRNLTHEMIITTNKAEIRWYVRPPHDAKAAWTNKKREWLGFFDDEIQKISEMAAENYGLILVDRLRTE